MCYLLELIKKPAKYRLHVYLCFNMLVVEAKIRHLKVKMSNGSRLVFYFNSTNMTISNHIHSTIIQISI